MSDTQAKQKKALFSRQYDRDVPEAALSAKLDLLATFLGVEFRARPEESTCSCQQCPGHSPSWIVDLVGEDSEPPLPKPTDWEDTGGTEGF